MNPSCGRADLARLLGAEDQGLPELFCATAKLVGYEPEQLTGFGVPWRPEAPRLASLGALEARAEITMSPVAPKARFLRVGRAIYPETVETERIPVEREVAPWEDKNRGDALDFPDSDPLVPWPRLWRRLRPHLSQAVQTRELDLGKLVERMSRADPVLRLPRVVRLRFASRPRILLDRTRRQMPFWRDQDRLCAALARWTLRDGSEPLAFLDGIDPAAWLRFGSESARGSGHSYAGSVVLLVGDLGAYGDPPVRERWRRAGQWFRSQGAELRALVPCPAGRLDPDLARLWNAMPWEPSERRATALTLSEQRQRAERLLTVVSPAIRIELGLLRAARALLPPEATDSGTEADAVANPAVIGRSSVALTLDSARQKELARAFTDLPEATQTRFRALLERWHAGLPREILDEELFHLAERSRGLISEEERERLRAVLVRTLRAFDRPAAEPSQRVPEGVFAWFRALETRLPEGLWLDPELGESLRRTWAIVHRDDPTANTPPGLDPNALQLPAPAEPLTPRRWRVWQVGARLEVLPADSARSVGPPEPRPRAGSLPVGSPLAEMTATEPRLVVAVLDRPGTRYPLGPKGTANIVLPVAAEGALAWTLTTDHVQLCLGVEEKQPWAKRMGRDAYGLHAEIEVEGVVQRMRWIGPGRFWMGSPEDEPERWAKGEHLHEVELTEGYWLADTVCTQVLWEGVMGKNPSRFQENGAKRPVERVSWDDCQEFVRRLNERAPGLELRLPREAEWEYACRAGTRTPFSFGENITPEQVNYDGNYPYAGGAKGEYRRQTVPVKTLPPNGWGLYEMHGNVLEWCEDWFGDYEPGTVMDPRGPETGQHRVLRGGCWYGYGRFVRSAYRSRVEPGSRYDSAGFRLARGR